MSHRKKSKKCRICGLPEYTLKLCYYHWTLEHGKDSCPICLEVPKNDFYVVSCCGKQFCSSCLKKWQAANRKCPLCRYILGWKL